VCLRDDYGRIYLLNQYLKRTIMNMKTSEATKDVPAVNCSSLSDGFYEAESISQKSVCRVMLLSFDE
jgi:hypothetical protein